MNNIFSVIYFFGMLMLISFLTKNVIELLFHLENYAIHRRRLNQLRHIVDKENKSNFETIEQITKPVVDNILPKISKYIPSLNVKNIDQMKMDLKMADWEDTFTPETFIATSLMTKALGLFVLLVAFMFKPIPIKLIGAIWGLALFFILDIWFRGSIKGKKEKLFNDFPDFIRITSGYLSANVSLVQAVSDAIKYVGEDWKPILRQFVIECDTKGTDQALQNLKDNVDLFEVKEFVGLVRLTLEQGGNARDGFLQQAEKITEMKRNLMIIKIGRRKTWAQVLQGPLLLCNMAILALPTIANIQVIMQ